ncbi:MAG: DVU0772 family protein [Desulfomicrobiaceae bacterium]
MGQLRRFKDLVIDWEMTPEDAVALYLEWGNNGYRGGYQNAVRSKTDHSNYFVVNTWKTPPTVTLVRRNSDGAEELVELPLPESLARDFVTSVHGHKGVYGVNEPIRQWLEREIFGRS